MKYFLVALIVGFLSVFGGLDVALASAGVTSLRCEDRVEPLGIDVQKPRFSWKMTSTQRGDVQTAYQIVIDGVWDSGKVQSSQSIQVEYSGPALAAASDYWWKVRLWDAAGNPIEYSAPAKFSTGLAAWTAQWIGRDETPISSSLDTLPLPARYFRRDFTVDPARQVARATAYVCGLGFFDLSLNGQRVSDHIMDPALSDYTKAAYYVSFDVTGQVNANSNAIGVVLGNGRFLAPRFKTPAVTQTFGFPKLMVQLEIEYTDGTKSKILSDGSWRVTTGGPIRKNNEYDGEEYDARMEMPGWDRSGFNDANWEPAQLVAAPGGVIKSQMIEPMKITQVIQPVAITNPTPGTYIVDMGQNFYGAVRLKASGAAGTTVKLVSAYSLNPDGSLKTADNRGALCTDSYTFKGQGLETWNPRFKGQGFRRVQVTGFPGVPTVDNFEGLVIHTAVEQTGTFDCSNALINQTHAACRWGTRMYLRSEPLDPDRDERQAWMGDPAKDAESEAYNFNVAPFYTKWMDDVERSQRSDGTIPDIATFWNWGSGIEWPSVITIIPDWFVDFYGDHRLGQSHYAAMKTWVLAMRRYEQADGTLASTGYGDWCDTSSMDGQSDFGATPGNLVCSAYQYHNYRIMARLAALLGQTADQQTFGALADNLKLAFNARFLNTTTHVYQGDTQCGYVLAVKFGLVPDTQRDAVIEKLVDNILVTNNGHLSVGLIGMQWLMQTLTDIGRSDVAWTIATQTTRPSWGYMFAKGATTIWERWDGDTQGPSMNSEALLMQAGNLDAWFYQTLGGVRPASEGFKSILIKPEVIGDLTWANTSFDSTCGLISTAWTFTGIAFNMNVTIPPNTTAQICVPTSNAGAVTEGGVPASRVPGVTFVGTSNHYAIYTVGSGSYVWSSPFSVSVPSTLVSTTTHQGTDEIVTFTRGSGTWTPPAGVTSAQVLVVGGGGGGGDFGGGGGAGGLIYSGTVDVSGGAQTVTVGNGGGGTAALGGVGASGGNSIFGTLTAVGGGGGGSRSGASPYPGVNGAAGGSGGGGSASATSASTTGGAATSGQGNAGGGVTGPSLGSGGGGGAGTAGGNATGGTGTSASGGAGGAGLSCNITGPTVWYAGGGGGGGYYTATSGAVGAGGTGGGGAGAKTDNAAGTAGTANTGGGGGGAGYGGSGGAGGSGVVIVRYTYSATRPNTFSWFNTDSGQWSSLGNWNDGTFAPYLNGQADYTLNFDTAGTYTATNDLGSGFLLNQLNFGNPTLTLAGNSLEFTGASPLVIQNSSAAVTVGNALVLDATTTIGGSGNGTVILGGAISGAGGVTKAGNSTLTLAAANTYGGATAINRGTLKLAYNASVAVSDSGFDSATGLSNNANYRAAISPGGNLGFNTAWKPTGSGWTFQNYAGLAKGNGGWNLPAEPDGTQCAVLQEYNYTPMAYQTLSFPSAGTYTISFKSCYATAGNSAAGLVALYVGGTPVGSFTPTSSTIWNTYNISFNVPAAGNYEVCFQMNGTANNYITAIDQVVVAGTLNGSLPANSALAIAAGATFDVSDITAYALGSGASLSASGTGTSPGTNAAVITGATGGTVSLGARPLALTWGGALFGTDSTHPPLLVSQGTLSLGGNTCTVVVPGPPLVNGIYTLVKSPSAITGTVNPTPSFTGGSGLAAGATGVISIIGTNVVLTVTGTTGNYASWATSHGIAGQPAAADFDRDGLSNLMEYALGLDPAVPNGAVGTLSGRLLSFSKSAAAVANGDVTYAIEKSDDLGRSDPWTLVTPDLDTTTTISYTLPPGKTKTFARLKVALTP